MNTAMNELRKVIEKRRAQCEAIIAEANANGGVSPDTYAKALSQSSAYTLVLADLAFCASVYPDPVKREAA